MIRKNCTRIGLLCLALSGCCAKGPFIFVLPPDATDEKVAELQAMHPDADVQHPSPEEWSKQKAAWLERE